MKALFTLLPLIPFGISLAAQQCPVDPLAKYTWQTPVAGDEITVDANDAKASQQSVTFTGDVVAKRGQEVFYAEHITYDKVKSTLVAPEEVTYGNPDFAIRAAESDYSTATQSGNFSDLSYYLKKDGANGEAKTLAVDRKAETEDMTEAVYTTCPRLSRAWSIQAEKVHLDHRAGVGESWHSTFHIGKVPVFYFPYFSFPLDDRRKTGFLMPKFNLSEGRGLDINTPFYINIAPNQDATFYPRLMTKRGFMLGGEYRYLLKNLSGKVSATFLPDDLKADTKRWSFNTEHRYQYGDKLSVSARYQRVSDSNYVKDFEKTLDLSNKNFLESHLRAAYAYSPNFRLTGEFKHYQIANSNFTLKDKPYSVLPRLSGKGHWRLDNGLVLASDSEITHFNKSGSVSGWRFDQLVSASYPIKRTYGFIRPTASYRLSHYQLKRQAPGVKNSHTRAIPTFSLDSGLYFDRQTTWFGKAATQSLEPRLFYLYTPYRDQSELPDFDTSNVNSTYESLFLRNRFIGKDRIGDANQLTTAISSTLTDNDSGKEIARIAVGQIQYFEDRRVSLLDTVSDQSRSNIIAEGRLNVADNIRLRGLVHYDSDATHAEKSLLGISYNPDTDKAVSVSHLYDEDHYKQVDFSGVWRLNDKWRTFWRWNYSIDYDKTIDTFAGVEYADCCWGLRLLARQYRDSLTNNQSPETAVYLEFALKGLGNIGNDTTTMLRDVVPNYRPISYEKPQ